MKCFVLYADLIQTILNLRMGTLQVSNVLWLLTGFGIGVAGLIKLHQSKHNLNTFEQCLNAIEITIINYNLGFCTVDNLLESSTNSFGYWLKGLEIQASKEENLQHSPG